MTKDPHCAANAERYVASNIRFSEFHADDAASNFRYIEVAKLLCVEYGNTCLVLETCFLSWV